MKLDWIKSTYNRVDDEIDRKLGDKARFQTSNIISAILTEHHLRPVSFEEARRRAVLAAWAIDPGIFGGKSLEAVFESLG